MHSSITEKQTMRNANTGRGRLTLRLAIIGIVSVLVYQMFSMPQTQAYPIYSPYYRYSLPLKHDAQQVRVLDSITHGNERVVLFTKDRLHQLGVKTEHLVHAYLRGFFDATPKSWFYRFLRIISLNWSLGVNVADRPLL